jgi:hypothetical protein
MEYKRDIDGAGLSDHADGRDAKRACLPPLGDFIQLPSQYWDQAVGGADQSTELAWMQPNGEYLPPNFGQLPEPDAELEQIFASCIDEQQLTDGSTTIDCTRQASLVVPSPTPATEESKACEEDQGSGAKEVDRCFGMVSFSQATDLEFG